MVWQGNYDKLFIGGDWVAPESGERIEVTSPFTEQVLAAVPSASPADVDRAVAAARRAFDNGPWPRMTVEERIAGGCATARRLCLPGRMHWGNLSATRWAAPSPSRKSCRPACRC